LATSMWFQCMPCCVLWTLSLCLWARRVKFISTLAWLNCYVTTVSSLDKTLEKEVTQIVETFCLLGLKAFPSLYNWVSWVRLQCNPWCVEYVLLLCLWARRVKFASTYYGCVVNSLGIDNYQSNEQNIDVKFQ
jgi:hypothetical protein